MRLSIFLFLFFHTYHTHAFIHHCPHSHFYIYSTALHPGLYLLPETLINPHTISTQSSLPLSLSLTHSHSKTRLFPNPNKASFSHPPPAIQLPATSTTHAYFHIHFSVSTRSSCSNHCIYSYNNNIYVRYTEVYMISKIFLSEF